MHRAFPRIPARRISTAARFPPPEARSSYVPPLGGAPFDPQTWLSVQPPAPSLVSSFAHRVGLLTPGCSALAEKRIAPLVRQVCTHPSFIALFSQHKPNDTPPPSNAALDAIGNGLLGLFAAEHVHALYPHLPTRALKAAVTAHVGPMTLCAVARELGAVPLLRWQRMPRTPTKSALIHDDALMTIPRSLVGLIYQLNSINHARQFVHAFFLSRQVDLRQLIKFRDPKLSLIDTLIKFGWEKPVSRLLAESGRHSHSPVYVVGVYSGAVKLGEGFGSSLRMAEYRSCEDALLRLYLTRAPSDTFTFPTTMFQAAGSGSLFVPAAVVDAAAYVPPQLGEAEVVREWTGKSGVVVGGRGSRERFEKRLEAEAEDQEQGAAEYVEL